mmetsp:Transcript_32429/g.65529  ORF Transcript_32429/g.65529 Transcript_32429/m.65529 type:complete len:87 (-) Transcript_32429:217-477(-)
MGCIVVGGVVPIGSGNPFDKDWDELNAKQLEAAMSLGYTEHSWDNDIELPIDKLSWRQLTDAQRSALSVLGQSEKTWNAGSDSDSD